MRVQKVGNWDKIDKRVYEKKDLNCWWLGTCRNCKSEFLYTTFDLNIQNNEMELTDKKNVIINRQCPLCCDHNAVIFLRM